MTSVVDLLRLTGEIRSDEEFRSRRDVATNGAVKVDPRRCAISGAGLVYLRRRKRLWAALLRIHRVSRSSHTR